MNSARPASSSARSGSGAASDSSKLDLASVFVIDACPLR